MAAVSVLVSRDRLRLNVIGNVDTLINLIKLLIHQLGTLLKALIALLRFYDFLGHVDVTTQDATLVFCDRC